MQLYTQRKLVNGFNMVAAALTTMIGLFFLGWILFMLVERGLSAFSVAFFTEMTPPPGSSGGLANAIVGSFLLTFFGMLIAAPIGVIAGTWLSEFGKTSALAELVRTINDILLSAPSIVMGIFVYMLIVKQQGHFSGWAGSVALALVAIPIVLRTTEGMLMLVPAQMREAAFALGAPQRVVVMQIVYKAAATGIMTGLLLSTAQVFGETAPLLFTALNNQFWSLDMNGPMANLPVIIYNYAMSPFDDWRELAWGGALLIAIIVLSTNIFARIMLRDRK